MQTVTYCLYDIEWENEELLPSIMIVCRHRKVGMNNMRDFIANKMKMGEAKDFGMIHLTGTLKNKIMSEVLNSESLRSIWKASVDFHKGERGDWSQLKDRELRVETTYTPFNSLI